MEARVEGVLFMADMSHDLQVADAFTLDESHLVFPFYCSPTPGGQRRSSLRTCVLANCAAPANVQGKC